jgi:hypothetical protein
MMPVLSGPAVPVSGYEATTPYYVVTDGARVVVVWPAEYYLEDAPEGLLSVRDGMMEAFGHRLSRLLPDPDRTTARDVMEALSYNMPYAIDFIDHEDGEPGMPATFEEGVLEAQRAMSTEGSPVFEEWGPERFAPIEVPRFEYDENGEVVGKDVE